MTEVVAIKMGSEHLDAAALIWARATAARDGDPEVAPLELARPVLDAVFAQASGTVLLTALDAAGTPLGFALVAPRPAGDHAGLEVTYLGVEPDGWGQGVAGALLAAIAERVATAGAAGEAWLWVYADNDRAVRAYHSAGWQPTGEERVHPQSGRIERRFRLRPPRPSLSRGRDGGY